MQFSINLLILIIPALALSLSPQDDLLCNVEECADVIDSSGCWNFAKSKSALLDCVPKGSVGVSSTREDCKYTKRDRFVHVLDVI
jgi:hypothetical protein